MTITEKLDNAYGLGIVAFVSDRDILTPIRHRGDIREIGGGIFWIRRAPTDRWQPVRQELIKFVRRHHVAEGK